MSNYCNRFDDVYMGFDDGTFVGLDKTIDHIAKTGTSGLVDTYTIFYTDDTTFEYQITNGEDGDSPEISVSEITGGHRLTITDRSGTDTIDIMDGEKGDQGEPGEDGVSPVITVTSIVGGHTVTVTDVNGTRSFTVLDGVDGQDGEDGEDGFSPTISITEISGGHRVAVTDAEGTNTFDVMDGTDGAEIQSIEKTATVGLTDTYTITLTDGNTYTFDVHNGTASIDKTLTISDAGADAKVTGTKLKAAESNIDYGINGIIDGTYRERISGLDLEWEDGGVSGTGELNQNAYSIRTGLMEFSQAKVLATDTHATYRCTFYAYNRTTGDYVSNKNHTDIREEYPFELSSNYKYRIVLYNTANDVRAVPDNFQIFDPEVKTLAQIEGVKEDLTYSAESLADGTYRKRYLGTDIIWYNGGINSAGAETDTSVSIRTDFIEFDTNKIIVSDPAGANVYFGVVAYDKSTDAFVSLTYVTNIAKERQIAIDPQYKYRLYIQDVNSQVRPSADTLVIYECRDVIKQRKKDIINILTEHGGFSKRRPLVTIVDDDGYIDFYNRLFDNSGNYLLDAPICTAYEGIKLGNNSFMSIEQLRTVQDAGCEILGHGDVPLAPKTLDPEVDPITIDEAEADVIANLKPIMDAGISPVGFVYPSGSTNVAVREMISRYYAYAMTTVRHLSSTSPDYDKVHNFGCVPHFAINRYPLMDANNELKSWNDISSIVQAAVADDGWLVLYMHLHKDTGETATAQTLNAIIANIINAGAEIVTATEAFEVFRNAWQAGDYLGGWNRVNSWGIEYEDHTSADAGSAMNRLGQQDILFDTAETEGY